MSYSVPTSPAVSRSMKAQPLTPQRPPQKHQQRSQSLYRSPLTPSTSPYTPISLRSVDTTGSSTLTTPDNSGLSSRKRLIFAASPEVVRNGSASKDRSLADIAENWRSRGSPNDMETSYASKDDPSYVIDESSDMSLLDAGNDSGIANNEVLLDAPFLATHRKLNSVPNISNRPRAHSHASIPTSRVQPSSPVTSRKASSGFTTSPVHRHTSSRTHLGLISTPPPNRALARQLKVKGSLTDPPQRRREALGTVPIPSNNTSMSLGHDTSLDLFDIDETDVEYENDEIENSFSCNHPGGGVGSYGYPNFAPLFPPQSQPQTFGQSTFADPFHPSGNINGLNTGQMLNSIGESVEQYFHAARQQQSQHLYLEGLQPSVPAFFNPRLPPRFNQVMPQTYHSPALVPIPHTSMTAMPALIPSRPIQPRSLSGTIAPLDATNTHVATPTDCSVCFAVHPTSLAVLQPCGHPLCSGCLTSALNIVGEKDMECAVCKQGVADFRLVIGTQKSDVTNVKSAELSEEVGEPLILVSSLLKDPLSHPLVSFDDSNGTHENSGDLDGAFEFGLDFGELRASTPKMEQQFGRSHSLNSSHGASVGTPLDTNVVLRIDNVPWDITPLQISRWLQQPVERVHVLLDPKGKTLSHAYVEVRDAAIAGAVLRGEALSSAGKKERGSVLGRGRRARGVTITRSGQPELMRDLFPHWRGNFIGSRPSLAGLDNEKMIIALEGGLLTEHEVAGLSQLIREPDSHFLKVPCLPFHSLISLLTKFPDDVDSRMFWSASVRDMLFDATYTAVQVLHARITSPGEATNKSVNDEEYPQELLMELSHTGVHCKAFTPNQIRKLTELAEASGLPIPDSEARHSFEVAGSSSSSLSSSVNNAIPPSRQFSQNRQPVFSHADGSLDELAREFGVDTHVVQALAQRLAKLC